MKYNFIKIREQPDNIIRASEWFHSKWGIPISAYKESMENCVNNCTVPQWYIVTDKENIIAGLGVIENDFHSRADLTPNVCAVYVEKEYRNQGIAKEMLSLVCEDMESFGIDTLYLLTDKIGFYERCGWEYLCPVRGDGEEKDSRMYIHSTRK